jgi:hypothetical protein
MGKCILLSVMVTVLFAGVAAAQEVPPAWDPALGAGSGTPNPMSLTIGNVVRSEGGAVDIPITIDQPATIYLAVYSVGANPPEEPMWPLYGPNAGYWDFDNEVWVGEKNSVARGKDTNIDTLVWRTPDDGVFFESGSHVVTWPGTDRWGNPMPAGDYTYYVVAWGKNVQTVGRTDNNQYGQGYEIDWSTEPPSVWSRIASNQNATGPMRLIRSSIGTDYVANPNAYEIFDGTSYLQTASVEVGGASEPNINAFGYEMDPRFDDIFYLVVWSGAEGTGIYKTKLNDDGTFELVTEFGEGGYFYQSERVYAVDWYDGALYIPGWNHEDLVDEIVKIDPDTGDIIYQFVMGVWSGIRIEDDGSEAPYIRGPGWVSADDRGVYCGSIKNHHIPHFDHDGNMLWINTNGDFFADQITIAPGEAPGGENTEWIVIAQHPLEHSIAWKYHIVGLARASQDPGTRCGQFLGPDGTGFGSLHIEGWYQGFSQKCEFHEFGNTYDGFYVGTGWDATLWSGTEDAKNYDIPSWLVYVPGRIERAMITTTVGVEAVDNSLPRSYALEQNYPNPFNPSTTIRFDLAKASNVLLTVYNVTGQEVARLADESLGVGSYVVEWDGRDMSGQLVSSGVYFYKLQAGDYTATKRMMLMK